MAEKSGTRKRAKPTTAVSRAVARTIDDALEVLAARRPASRRSKDDGAPLPSLLERCETLLQRTRRAPATLRTLHTFSLGAGRLGAALLAQLPNVRGLEDVAIETDGDLEAGTFIKARAAALRTLQDAYEARFIQPVLRLDHLTRYRDHQAAAPDPTEAMAQGRRIVGLILVEHPLLSYLEARHAGALRFQPVSLEAYAKRYNAFLSAHLDLPRISADDVAQSYASVLARAGEALELTLPASYLADIDALEGEQVLAVYAAGRPDLRFSDGSPATEERLDGPAYLRLCQELGYAPDALPPVTGPAPGRRPGLRLRQPIPARRADRTPSRLAAFLPVLARTVDAAPTRLAPIQIDAGGLTATVEDCLGHPGGFYEALDAHLGRLPTRDAALLLIGCAAHFSASNQPIHVLGLLSEAEALIAPDDRPLRLLLAELYLRHRNFDLALRALSADALSGPLQLERAQQATLRTVIAGLVPAAASEHGHALLLDRLAGAPPPRDGARRVLIEIGTTREAVPGQGSTEKLARLCQAQGIDFITVDMDPRNSAVARRLFRKLGLPFRAVTAKGEDFLADWQGPIDYCFIDAYDFDHGMHSELRQSRYETFLGSRIDDAQCHKMHLDCAVSLAEKLAPDGIICLDDTWIDTAGDWTAKGKTAMPYLLGNGFKVIEARNKAALLVRA